MRATTAALTAALLMVSLGAGTVSAREVQGPTGTVCASSQEDIECEGVAASGTGDTRGAAALTGSGEAYGGLAASGTGNATGVFVAASGTGDATGFFVAASGTGNATGILVVASGTGDATRPAYGGEGYAVSGTGDATCHGSSECWAVSGTGHAEGSGVVVSGCETVLAVTGSDAACLDADPGEMLP